MASQTLAIAGAKGGVGKTTTSLNLGAALRTRGFEVLVVETDLAMANIEDFIDISPSVTLHEVLANGYAPDEAITTAPGDFDVLSSGTAVDSYMEADVTELPGVIDSIRSRYDVIIFDTGAGVSHESLLPIAYAGRTIIVSTPRVASVRDASKTAEFVDRLGGEVVGVLFTKSGTGRSPPPERIARQLDFQLLGHVPDDTAVPAAQDSLRPVVLESPDSPAANAYRDLVETLLEIGSLPLRHQSTPLEGTDVSASDNLSGTESPADTS